MFDRLFMGAIFVVGGLLALATVVAIPIAIYDEVVSEKFYLRKDSWTCTRSHTETYVTYTQVGNTSIPIPYDEEVCDQWTRI